MQRILKSEPGRPLIAALMTVLAASSAIAQTTRITRTESEFDIGRRIAPGEMGSSNDIRRSSTLGAARDLDLSKVDRRALTNLLREAYDESGRLYTSLQSDYQRYPQLRSLLSDLKTLRSRTSLVNQDLAANVPLDQIVIDFREIDADWRLFSHRMMSLSGSLSTATRQSLERVDNIDRQVGKLFQVEPSLDRYELSRQLGILENSLYAISDELRRDLNTSTRLTQLVSDTRRLEVQIGRIEDFVIDNYPYERIVTEYNLFERGWNSVLEQLNTVNNSYIERAVMRMVEADSEIHDLLWIENSTSRPQLKQNTDALIKDVDEFYNRTPLKLLLTFRNSSGSLQMANDFYGVVQNFKDNLDRNESDEELINSYRYLEEQGALFVRTFSQMKSQAAIVVLREIEDDIAALRRELNLGGTVTQVDTRKLLTIAASLDNLSYNLDFDVRQWLNTARPANRTDVMTASSNFMKRTRRMHQMLDSNPTLNELQREADMMYQDWQTIYQYLGQCRTAQRQRLSETAAEIRQDLTELNDSLRL
ncbi:MAG: hypothetical protein ACK58L_12960 [Planctomycetota bacterium]